MIYHPGAFTEKYISRKDPNEQIRENEKFDLLKNRVARAAADLEAIMKIDLRSG